MFLHNNNIVDRILCPYYTKLLWPPYESGRPYFCPVVSIYLLSIFFIFSLISAAVDRMYTILPYTV